VPWADNILDIDSPQSAFVGALKSSIVISGVLRVYGFTVSSTNAGSQFVQWFDLSALPADGVVPIAFTPVAASNSAGVFYGDSGRVFGRGLVLCNSTTAGTKTIGAADCLFDVQYDLLHT
jgi:hypothetical protein